METEKSSCVEENGDIVWCQIGLKLFVNRQIDSF